MATGGHYDPETSGSEREDEAESDSDEASEDEDFNPETIYFAPMTQGQKRAQEEKYGTDKIWNIVDSHRKPYNPVRHGGLLQLEQKARKDKEKPKRNQMAEAVVRKKKDKIKARYNPMDDVEELQISCKVLDEHIKRLRRVVNGGRDELSTDDLIERLTCLFKRLRHLCNSKWKLNSAPDFDKAVRDSLKLLEKGMVEPQKFIDELQANYDLINIDVRIWKKKRPRGYKTPELPFYEPSEDFANTKTPGPTWRDKKTYKKSPLAIEDSAKTSPSESSSPSPSRSTSQEQQSLPSRLSSLSLNTDRQRPTNPPSASGGISSENNELTRKFQERTHSPKTLYPRSSTPSLSTPISQPRPQPSRTPSSSQSPSPSLLIPTSQSPSQSSHMTSLSANKDYKRPTRPPATEGGNSTEIDEFKRKFLEKRRFWSQQFESMGSDLQDNSRRPQSPARPESPTGTPSREQQERTQPRTLGTTPTREWEWDLRRTPASQEKNPKNQTQRDPSQRPK